jgi:peptidoglycan/xylan/chitin deacetylase (PgdA/CDA1 family)
MIQFGVICLRATRKAQRMAGNADHSSRTEKNPTEGLAFEIGASIYAVRTDARNVVLTYDDGPQPGGTERVLEALAEYDATATFFVLLTRVRRCRRLFAEVVKAGHEIGLHGMDHRKLPELDPADVEARTNDARSELQDLLGEAVVWFRPPYGAQSRETWQAVTRTGMTPVLWSHSLEDWRDVPAGIRHDIALDSACPGSIMLAHDGYASREDGASDGKPPEIDRGELARDLLQVYRECDLSGCSLARALEDGDALMRVWLIP